MSVWFTADLHLGHDRVVRERMRGRVLPRYNNAAIDAHDRELARNWDECVGATDHVWVLGDVSVGGTECVAHALNWIWNRPGTKHLIPGNHDPVHPMYRDAHKWQSAFGQVFASVQPFARRRIAGRQVLLSHFPYIGGGDHTDEERFGQYRLQDHGLPLLHGHTHSEERTSWVGLAGFPLASTLQIHVGVDAWQHMPVHIDVLAELIETETR